MKETVYRKLEGLVERYEEVQAMLSDAGVISDQNRFRELSKEYSQLEEIARAFGLYQQAQQDLVSAEEMLKILIQICVKWRKKNSKLVKSV